MNDTPEPDAAPPSEPPSAPRILARDREPLLNALRTGVVPARGAHLIQVGRHDEIASMIATVKQVRAGEGAARFVIGDYGSGNTYFLNLVRAVAHKERLVTVAADLTPDRRLQGSQGRSRKLYSALIENMATKGKPGGRALTSVVERFVTAVEEEAAAQGDPVRSALETRLRELREHSGGPTFAKVVMAYWQAHEQGDEELRAAALRWLQGEYATKTEATRELGVREIIEDRTVFDHLKLMSVFVTMAGYGGLLVCLDEMVNLYKLSHKGSRTANYEQILNIVNETQQGYAPHLGFLFSGTPQFLEDDHRGLFSYDALRSRLRENPFATGGLVDYNGPVMRLGGFSKEHFYELLRKVSGVYRSHGTTLEGFDDTAVEAFMRHCDGHVGDAYFRTPRSTIKEFIGLMDVVAQNRGTDWRDLLDRVDIRREENPDLAPLRKEDDVPDVGTANPLASFRI
ncbi:ATP-binding protein [Nocardiopsis protaetiae]|uniref:ATP-binding protein n=1 Tax=Nocardiopsis protaetiae TaxID=3382270 RepID=UPI00387ADE68